MKKHYGVVLLVAMAAGWAGASAIKTWSNGELLSAGDLNANFQHIHNLMVGGHGARLVNADVSTGAAIAHSKLATPAVLPKAWTGFVTLCGAGVCTETAIAGSGVTSIAHTAVGKWTVTWSTARANNAYIVQVTPFSAGSTVYGCYVQNQTTAAVFVECKSLAPAFADVPFYLTMMDDL